MQAFINTSSAARAPRSTSLLHRVGSPVIRAGRWLRDNSRRHSVINELDRLSDRELADIGLARGDIRSIFSGTNAGR
jgi:uncharacterized protein YjiS (DUF1127 family)